MNNENALQRIDYVLMPDSMTISNTDFLLTHVPMKNLFLLDRFNSNPDCTKLPKVSEQDILNRFVMNLENRHQFITVYGVSGSGKSHLIRWLYSEFKRRKNENETVIFIRRSNNTLRAAIQQLLEVEGFENVGDPKLKSRLTQAIKEMTGSEIKINLYYKILALIANLQDKGKDAAELSLSGQNIKRLAAFLSETEVKDYFINSNREDNVFNRIASRIYSDHRYIDQEVLPEFKVSDFNFDLDFLDLLQNSSGIKARKFIQKLIDDTDGKLKNKIVSFLNSIVPTAITESAGIQNGDLKERFHEIRRELKRQGKNLTVFIEDITSFTGVDTELLDVLMEEHSGSYEQEGFCRVSSFVGTTTDYLRTWFRDNHKDRITEFVYLKPEQFTSEDRYELFGRYLNAISLSESKIAEWYENNDEISQIPVHTQNPNISWDSVNLPGNKTLSLFPFTKNSIENLYSSMLNEGNKTTRYLLHLILLPLLKNYLEKPLTFPDQKLIGRAANKGNINAINQAISSSGLSKTDETRLFSFLSVWGDNSYSKTQNDNLTYHNGIPEDVFQLFGFPIPKFPEKNSRNKKVTVKVSISNPAPNPDINAQKKEDYEKEIKPDGGKKPEISNKSEIEQRKFEMQQSILLDWAAGSRNIDFRNTRSSGDLRQSLSLLTELVEQSINWEAEGVSPKLIKDSVGKKYEIYKFKGTEADISLFEVERSMENLVMFEALLRLTVFGKWRKEKGEFPDLSYDEAIQDLEIITSWIYRNKKKLIDSLININSKPTSYVQAYFLNRIMFLAMTGDFDLSHADQIDPLSILDLTSNVAMNETSKTHIKKWYSFLEVMNENEKKNDLELYFDLPQGKSKIRVLDYQNFKTEFEKIVHYLKKNNGIPKSDDTIPFRKKIWDKMSKNYENLEMIVQEEEKNQFQLQENLKKYLGSDYKDEDVIGTIKNYKKFRKQTDNIPELSTRIKNLNENQISVLNLKRTPQALKQLNEKVNNLQSDMNPIEKFFYLSLINIDDIKAIIDLLTEADADVRIAESYLQSKGPIMGQQAYEADYSKQKSELQNILIDIAELKEWANQ